jgi:hypothetical protein
MTCSLALDLLQYLLPNAAVACKNVLLLLPDTGLSRLHQVCQRFKSGFASMVGTQRQTESRQSEYDCSRSTRVIDAVFR